MENLLKNKIRNRHHSKIIAYLFGGLLVFSMLSGCTSANITAVQSDPSVDQMFTDSQLPDTYTYYHIGTEYRPYAILGLAPGYSLANTHWWVSLGNDASAAAGLVDAVKYDYWWETSLGGIVKDPAGKQVGILYTGVPSAWAEVDSDNRQVYVIMEDPWSISEPDVVEDPDPKFF